MERRVTAAVWLLALAAAIWAMAGVKWLEPHLSINADEYAYVHQAKLLARGHIVVDTPKGKIAPSFQPWFAIPTDDGYVFKYNPVWPAVLALGDLVGFFQLGVGLAAAAFVLGTFFLTAAILESRTKALVATALVVFAPVTVLQFTSYLSYILFGALWTFAAGLLVHGVQRRRAGPVAAAGVLGGLAFCARPYDAVLVLAPFVAWAVWEVRHERRYLTHTIGIVLAAAAPLVALQLVYNQTVTGSATKFPFSAWAPLDKLGFGPRGLDPVGGPDVNFTIKHGLVGAASHVWQFWDWSYGGIALAAVGAVGLVALRRRPVALAALAIGMTLPLGYVFFWGGYQIARLGEFFQRFGPYYFLPLLIPAGAFAAEGLFRLWTERRRVALAAVAAMTAFAGFGGTRAFGIVFDERAAREQPYALLARRFSDPRVRAVVILPEPYVGLDLPDVYSLEINGRTPVLYAAEHHNLDLDVVEAFPERDAYRLLGCDYTYRGQLGTREVPADSTHLFRLVSGKGSRLQPLTVRREREYHFELTIASSTAPRARVTVDAGAHAAVATVHRVSGSGRAVVEVTVTAEGVTLTGDVDRPTTGPGNGGPLIIQLDRDRGTGERAAGDPDYSWEAPMRSDGATIAMLSPPSLKTIADDLGVPFESQQCRAQPGARLRTLP